MKTSLTISVLVAVLLHFQTSIASAQGKPPGAGGARGGHGGHGGGKSAIFTALDANRDGAIDAAELANASVALKKLDTNGDGKIAEDEAAPAGGPGMAAGATGPAGGGRPGMRGRGAAPAADANNPAKATTPAPAGAAGGGKGRHGRPAAPADTTETVNTLMSFDKNGDGKLSRAEVPERMQGLFDRCDKNTDGFLTGDEIKAAADEQSKTAGAAAPAGKGRRPSAK